MTATDTGGCDACLARAWLLAQLAGHLDQARDRVGELLTLPDAELIAAVGGARRTTIEREHAAFDAGSAREQAASAGVELLCRCRAAYPDQLRELAAPPAVLHVCGSLEHFLALAREPAAAIVGSRRPSAYGMTVARSLGRGLAAAGVGVVSGMALGIDGAAHRGALDRQAPTVAVLAGAAERAYPASARALHERIRATGSVVSELPPRTASRRWMFPARNRIIAALGALTVVVEARPRSGALVTARHALELGRALGAVPGRVTSPLARGPHGLLREGARLIEGPEDALEALFGPGATRSPARAGEPLEPLGPLGPLGPLEPAEPLQPPLQALLDALAEGHGTASAFVHAGLAADTGLAALAALELAGRIQRGAGGRYIVSASQWM